MRRLRFNDTPLGDPKWGLLEAKTATVDLVMVRNQVQAGMIAPAGQIGAAATAKAAWRETVAAQVWVVCESPVARMKYPGVLAAGCGKESGVLKAETEGTEARWENVRLIRIEELASSGPYALLGLTFDKGVD